MSKNSSGIFFSVIFFILSFSNTLLLEIHSLNEKTGNNGIPVIKMEGTMLLIRNGGWVVKKP